MIAEQPAATGGRHGIGQGIAFALAAAGFDLVIDDLVRDAGTEATLAGIAERGVRAIVDPAAHPRPVDAACAGSTAWSTAPASRS